MMVLTLQACFLFFKKTDNILALRLNVVFRRILYFDNFPAHSSQTDVTAIQIKIHLPPRLLITDRFP